MLLSCASMNFNKKSNDDKIMISFGSVYENERLTLSINDSLYFRETLIETNSLGTDPKKYIEIKSDEVHLDGKFIAQVDPEFDETYTRTLKIDTILYKQDGSRIIIGANYDKYYVTQQNKKFKVE